MSKSKPTAIQKDLKYSVAVGFVDFKPSKYTPRTIIFEGKLAIQLKGRVYTKAS